MYLRLQHRSFESVFTSSIWGASALTAESCHGELNQQLEYCLSRRSFTVASFQNFVAPIRLWHACSGQSSGSSKTLFLPALRQLNMHESWLTSNAQGPSHNSIFHRPQGISTLSRKPKLVDEVCHQLQENGWNSSTADKLEGLDGLYTPRIVAMVLSERIPMEAAMGFFHWIMKQDGFKPTTAVYTAMIGVLGKAGHIDEVESIVNDMSKVGCDMDVVAYTQLIHAYKIADDIDKVINVYERMKENKCKPNVVFYTAMIGALAKAKQYQKLTEIYSEMVKTRVFPNIITYNILMKTLYEAGNLDGAFEILKRMQRMKVHPGPSTYALFIEAYAKEGNIKMVQELVNEMKSYGFTPGPIYSNIIHRLAKEGNEKQAIVIAQALWPDEKSRAKFLNFEPFSKVLPGVEHQKHENKHGTSKFSISDIIESLQNWTPVTVSTLEAANIDWKSHGAVSVIKRVKDVNVALEFYYWLKKSGFKHDIHTSSALILRLAKSEKFSDKFSSATKLLQELKEEGATLPLSVCNEFIKFASMKKKFKAAQMGLDLIKDSGVKPNLTTYSNLIIGLASNGKFMAALEQFQLMLRDGIRPDNTTITTLLYHVGSSDESEKAGSLFKELLQFGLKVDANVYMALLYAYCKHGKSEMAVKAYNEMKAAGVDPTSLTEDIAVILSSFDNPEEVDKLKQEDIKTMKSYVRSALSQEMYIGTSTNLQKHLFGIRDVLSKSLLEGNLAVTG